MKIDYRLGFTDGFMRSRLHLGKVGEEVREEELRIVRETFLVLTRRLVQEFGEGELDVGNLGKKVANALVEGHSFEIETTVGCTIVKSPLSKIYSVQPYNGSKNGI